MVRERKASEGEEEKVSNDGNMAWDQKMEEAESLHGLGNPQELMTKQLACFVELILEQKSGLAPHLLVQSQLLIPLKIANLLLLRLKARNNALIPTTAFPVNQEEQKTREVEENQFDHFFEMPGDFIIVENSDTANSTADAMTASDHMSGMPAVATCGYDLPSNLRINSNNNEEEEKRDGKGKYVKEEVQEVAGIPHAPTGRASSSPSSLSKEGKQRYNPRILSSPWGLLKDTPANNSMNNFFGYKENANVIKRNINPLDNDLGQDMAGINRPCVLLSFDHFGCSNVVFSLSKGRERLQTIDPAHEKCVHVSH
ncbi:hypothetical protein D5086_020326 [Populus alba]|uniref:Uncharacterized protein n=1 Tax=Populus alba TaxID=43335 RepID=A0ACC4BKC5_POPAL